MISVLHQIVWCADQTQDVLGDEHGSDGNHQAQHQADEQRVSHAAAHTAFISCAEILRYRNGETGTGAHDQAEHQEGDRSGQPNGGQRIHSQETSDDDGIGHVVELLEYIACQQGQRKSQYLF